MEDYELFPDEEEEATAEEGANRTFIILVGAMGGLLAVGLCIFAVWAFIINPRMTADRLAQNQSIEATNTAIAALAAGETATPEAPPDTAEPPAPSDTPEPVATEPPTEQPETPGATPTEAVTGGTPVGAVAASTPTDTPRPTATRRPTATTAPASGDVPDTGFSTLGASALAVGLLFLLVVVRRMRRTA